MTDTENTFGETQIDRQTRTETAIQPGIHILSHGQRDKYKQRQRERQTDRHRQKHTETQSNRERDIYTQRSGYTYRDLQQETSFDSLGEIYIQRPTSRQRYRHTYIYHTGTERDTQAEIQTYRA